MVIFCNLDLRDLLGGESLKPIFVEKRAYVNTLALRYLGDGLLVAALLLIWVWELQAVLTLLGGTLSNFW